MKIPDALLTDITSYCKANGLELNDYIVSALRQGHTVLKYGNVPRVKVEDIAAPSEGPVVVEGYKPTPPPQKNNYNKDDIYQED